MPNVVTLEEIKSVINSEVTANLAKSMDGIKTELARLSKAVSSQTKVDKGIYQARLIRAHVETMIKRQSGSPIKNNSILEEVADIVRKRYAETDPSFVDTVTERAKDLMATGNGGNLIVETYAADFLDLLWNTTIADKVGIRFMPTSTGNLTIPKILSGVAAGYVGEGGTIDTSTMTFGKIRLSVKKLMALVPISNDLLRYTSVNVDAILRDQLVKQLAQVADYAILYGKGGDYEPRGIANTADIQVEATPQITVANRAMGFKMLKAIGVKNHSLDGLFWLMGWDTYINLLEEREEFVGYRNPEMAQGMFIGHPFIVSNNVHKDATYEDLFLVKFSEFEGIQGMGLEIVASSEASIPTKNGILSAFAQDYTIIRAIVEHDFGLAYGHAAVLYKPLIATGS
jgi:HK97 family phage major capsid protein